MKEQTIKLNIKTFALACGILWSVGLFLLTWWIMAFDGETGERTLIGLVYRGYRISPAGSVFGLFWGFADGVVGGAIFAWLYNLLTARFGAGSRTGDAAMG